MKVSAIIVAAGMGRRMNLSVPKQYLCLQGIPILTRTVSIIASNPSVEETILVIPPGEKDRVIKLVLVPYSLENNVKIVEGGNTRFDSVKKGVESLVPDPPDMVLIHDGVRPLVDKKLVSTCIEEAMHNDGAIVAVPAKDTIKLVEDSGFVVETPDRSKLWHAQTPQVFRYNLFANSLKKWNCSKIPTDDALLLESTGAKIKIVEGHEMNLKITTQMDLWLAELVLKEKNDDQGRYGI